MDKNSTKLDQNTTKFRVVLFVIYDNAYVEVSQATCFHEFTLTIPFLKNVSLNFLNYAVRFFCFIFHGALGSLGIIL